MMCSEHKTLLSSEESLLIDIYNLNRKLDLAQEEIDRLEKLCARDRIHELEEKARRTAYLEERVRDLESRLESESARRLLAERRNDGPKRRLAERQVEELKRERLELARLVAEQDLTIEKLEEQIDHLKWTETKTVYGTEALGMTSCEDSYPPGPVAAKTYLSAVGRRSLVSRAKQQFFDLIGRE